MKTNLPCYLALLFMLETASGAERSQFTSRANTPPRKVVICTTMSYFKGNDVPARVVQAEQLVDQGAAECEKKYPGKGLDLVVLPEHAIASDAKIAVERGIGLDDPAVAALKAKARQYKTYIVMPILLLEEDKKRCSNAAILLDRKGEVAGIYRKVHPVADDLGVLERGITPGTNFPVFQADFGKVGFLICWDMGYEDGWKRLAEEGAEIVAIPSASPQTVRPSAHAFQNHYYVVTGTPRDNATIFNPAGITIAQTTQEPVLVQEIDLSFAVLHWAAKLDSGKGMTRQFGDKVGYDYSDREDTGVFWSNDPKTTIGSMIAQMGLLQMPDALERSRQLQEKARLKNKHG